MIKEWHEWYDKFWDWVMELPTPIFLMLTVTTVVFVTGFILTILTMTFEEFGDFETKCLDSQLARRWSHENACEEYYDGEWIEVDNTVYRYNNAAVNDHDHDQVKSR